MDGIVYVVNKMTYNNLRKFVRQFIGSGVRMMSKRAILLAMERLKGSGNFGSRGAKNNTKETIRKIHKRTLRIINIASDNNFVSNLLDCYATNDRVGMEKWQRSSEQTTVSS